MIASRIAARSSAGAAKALLPDKLVMAASTQMGTLAEWLIRNIIQRSNSMVSRRGGARAAKRRNRAITVEIDRMRPCRSSFQRFRKLRSGKVGRGFASHAKRQKTRARPG